jgi:hypothetical protein
MNDRCRIGVGAILGWTVGGKAAAVRGGNSLLGQLRCAILRNAFKAIAAVGTDSDVIGHRQVRGELNSRPTFGEGLVVARDMIAGVALGTDKRERATVF